MRRFQVRVPEGEIAGVAFGDPVRPVDCLFLHANGFNALTYQSILEPLGARAHVAGIDLRGHGRTKLPADPPKMSGWNVYRDDVIATLEQLAPQGCVIAGHSMGGVVALLVAAARPDLVKAVVAADPVLLDPKIYVYAQLPGMVGLLKNNFQLAKGARKRREVFDSPQQAAEYLKGRGAFQSWREPFLADFCVDGFIGPIEGGGFRLACAPSWEAANFGAQRHRPWSAISRMKSPLVVLKGEHRSTVSTAAESLILRRRPGARVITLPGTTHFLPMERPYAVRDAISEVFARVGEANAPVDEVRVRRALHSDALPD